MGFRDLQGSIKHSQWVCDFFNLVTVVELTTNHYKSCSIYYYVLIINIFYWSAKLDESTPDHNKLKTKLLINNVNNVNGRFKKLYGSNVHKINLH